MVHKKTIKGVSEMSGESVCRVADKNVKIGESRGIAQLLNNLSQLSSGCFLKGLVSKCESLNPSVKRDR